jgi:aspartate aminotransferase
MLTDFHRDGATVMVAPARGFYATPRLGADQVRIAYVLKEEDLRAAVEILAAGLETYARERGDARRVNAGSQPDGADVLLPQGT